jgi:hypothetical protein
MNEKKVLLERTRNQVHFPRKTYGVGRSLSPNKGLRES